MDTNMMDKVLKEALAHEILTYIKQRKDKKIEAFYKDKPKKSKQGLVINGAINIRLSESLKKITNDQDAVQEIEKLKRSKEQTPLAFQQEKFKKLISLVPENSVNEEIDELKNILQQFLTSKEEEYNPVNWLNQMTPKAVDISFATHVAKLTHSSSKGSSVFDITTDKNNFYLTTNTLAEPIIDTASSNAASLPIADILKLTVDGVSVLDCLKNDDKGIFQKITDSEEHLVTWCNNLKQAYDSTQKQSYFLSKQIYFPIQDKQYHLLLPLTSSSLVHAIHLEHKKYWDDSQVLARDKKYAKKYSTVETKTYPNKAHIYVTGSNHSNASALNGQRGGRVALLSAQPPQWSSQSISYQNRKSVFDKHLSYQLNEEITELRKYLLLIQSKQLSMSEPKRNAAIANKLQAICDSFFDEMQTISNNQNQRGWTIESTLPVEEQLLLEPWRMDEQAKGLKLNTDWHKVLSEKYGYWLNKQIKQKCELSLNTIHEALWADVFANELREYIAIQEVIV